ncbi:MAG: NAD-dependent epimerase/dehydratase family protein [Alphaproteobacteria bacterium]|nr:NAD-dependent epimerase/dehydratase family protein [Alphaproteobacteria bacterium]
MSPEHHRLIPTRRPSRVLITGVAGFVGFHLARRLLHEGVAVIGIDDFSAVAPRRLQDHRLETLRRENNKGFAFFEADCGSPSVGALPFGRLDAVVHLAAKTGVRGDERARYIESNIVGFSQALQVAQTQDAVAFLYASSSSVQHPESSYYAATKLLNEHFAEAFARAAGGLTLYGMRFFNCYGAYGRTEMIAYRLLDALLLQQPIALTHGGNQQRHFTYVDDVVETIWRLLLRERIGHRVFSIASPHPSRVNDMIDLLVAQTGLAWPGHYDVPAQASDVVANPAPATAQAELEEAIAYHPSTSLQEGLQRVVDWALPAQQHWRGSRHNLRNHFPDVF